MTWFFVLAPSGSLTKKGVTAGRLTLKLLYATTTRTEVPSEVLQVANTKANRALRALMDYNSAESNGTSLMSEVLDKTSPIETAAQIIVQDTTTLAPFVSPLGKALLNLETLMSLIDTVAEVGRPGLFIFVLAKSRLLLDSSYLQGSLGCTLVRIQGMSPLSSSLLPLQAYYLSGSSKPNRARCDYAGVSFLTARYARVRQRG
jgi:hypothetical protein